MQRILFCLDLNMRSNSKESALSLPHVPEKIKGESYRLFISEACLKMRTGHFIVVCLLHIGFYTCPRE